MKLYYSPGACSLAPHICLREADRHFDLERVDLAAMRTASGADYLSINPRGRVPALRLDGEDSDVLVESAAVLQYIADLAPEAMLAPANGTFARYHLQSWLSYIGSELEKPFSTLLYHDLPDGIMPWIRGRISERFLYLEDVLYARGFLMGERFTVADAYLWTVLQWCPQFGFDLQLYPNLDDYEYRISARPAVQAAMTAEGIHTRHEHQWKRTG